MGIAWVEPSERGRGLSIAASLALTLPYAAVIVENKCWDLCAKTFLCSAIVVFLSLCLPNSGRGLGAFTIDGFRVTNENDIAPMFAFAIFLLLSMHFRGTLFADSPRKSNAVTIALLFFFSAGIVLTGSRVGFILLAFSIASMVFVHAKKHRYLATIGSQVCLCCWALLVCHIQSDYLNSTWVRDDSNQAALHKKFTRLKSMSTLGLRTVAWHTGFSHMLGHPRYILYGVGTGGADAAIAKEILVLGNGLPVRTGRDNIPRYFSHALWLEWFMCYGLLGIISAGYFVAFAIRRAMECDQRDGVYDRRIFFVFLILANITAVTTRFPFSLAIGCLFLAAISKQLLFPVTVQQELQTDGKTA